MSLKVRFWHFLKLSSTYDTNWNTQNWNVIFRLIAFSNTYPWTCRGRQTAEINIQSPGVKHKEEGVKARPAVPRSDFGSSGSQQVIINLTRSRPFERFHFPLHPLPSTRGPRDAAGLRTKRCLSYGERTLTEVEASNGWWYIVPVIKATSYLIARFIKVFMWLCGRPITSVLWLWSSVEAEQSQHCDNNKAPNTAPIHW